MAIRYGVRPADPAAHLFHVTVEVDRPDPDGQRFTLPAWNPGSYMIREFARHIVRLTALSDGRRLRVEKTDKHTWRCARTPHAVTLAYEVYANDLTVRAAHLDTGHAFFNGAALLLAVAGQEDQACALDLFPPPAPNGRGWKVATGLAPARGTAAGAFGTYRAQDYAHLIDCPVEMGRFEHRRFAVLGIPHEIAITGQVARLDTDRIVADLERLCSAQIRLFEPRSRRAPFDRYVFMAMAVDDGYGGLEHRNSTALLCRRDELPYRGMNSSTEGYRRFLGLASHEYFHAWNVKRIRPSAFVPYDLSVENYTRLLWAFEGITSYYDDLVLARCGLLTEPQYLDTLAQTLSGVMQGSARLKQSLAQSSFDAWIKYYRQDENAPNSVVSYYQKGSLIALALDLAIRRDSGGRRSLDDVMRGLWRQWRTAGDGYPGLAEDGFAQAVLEATGLDLAATLRAWTEGTREPDYADLLATVGIRLESKPALQSPHFALLGLKLQTTGGEAKVSQVFDGGPAQRAGLSAGDVLVAFDGLRAAPGRLDPLLARYQPGERVTVLAFRREELLSFEVTLARQPPVRFELKPDDGARPQVRRRRAAWCGPRRG